MLLALVGVAGCGGDPTESNGSTDTTTGIYVLPAECVDIVVEPAPLPTPPKWSGRGSFGRNPFTLTKQLAFTVWGADSDAPDGEIVITGHDTTSGELGFASHANPVPGQGPASFALSAVSPEGQYGAFLQFCNLANNGFPCIVLGEAPSGKVAVSEVQDIHGAFHVGWDGEAFVVHSADVNVFQLTRFALKDGAIVRLTDKIDVGPVGSIYGADFPTFADSGRSWLTTAYGDTGVWVSGHERDGSLLPGAVPDGGRIVQVTGKQNGPNGEDVPTYAMSPAIAEAGDGAMLVWSDVQLNDGDDHPYPAVAQRIGADFEPIGDPVFFQTSGGEKALAVAPDGTGWLFVTVGREIHMLEIQGADVVDHGAVVAEPLTKAALEEECPDGPAKYCRYPQSGTMNNLEAVTRGGEVWLGFHDESGISDVETFVDATPYRIVKIQEGCVYQTTFDKLSDLR